MQTQDALIERILDRICPDIRALSAYHVADPGDAIKLDAMENPYQWDAELVEQWLEALRHAPLNRYPDPGAREVKEALRTSMQVPAAAEIIIGNGSDELIQILIQAMSQPGQTLLAPEPSFVMYSLLAKSIGMDYVGVPLRADDFALDMPAMLEAIATHQPALIFIANPNNPTGNAFTSKDLESILEQSNGVVVVDEAYTPFADETFMPRLEEYPNLLVMRTVSKLGLAGLRLGLLAGHPALLHELEKIRLPYNINVLTQLSAVFALQHADVFAEQTRQIRADRSKLAEELGRLAGVEVWPSQTNFLLFRVAGAPELFQGLRERGILIKNLHGSHPLLADCLRVTVGTPQENESFLKALSALLEERATR